MTSQELEFKDGNPGAVQYGNFINYYQFNPPDNRINLLPKNIWVVESQHISNQSSDISSKKTFLALDIGCNAGNLTNELVKFLQKELPNDTELQILAVDIDPILIQRAQEEYPSANIKFLQADCTKHRFTSSCHEFLQTYGSNNFDVVFCFSTTMWIHLNKGDEGLKDFIKSIGKLGRLLVLEPQPWKCYKSAVKRMKGKIVFEHFKKLKITEDVEQEIEKVLINEVDMQKIYESDKTPWKRKIYCFRQK